MRHYIRVLFGRQRKLRIISFRFNRTRKYKIETSFPPRELYTRSRELLHTTTVTFGAAITTRSVIQIDLARRGPTDIINSRLDSGTRPNLAFSRLFSTWLSADGVPNGSKFVCYLAVSRLRQSCECDYRAVITRSRAVYTYAQVRDITLRSSLQSLLLNTGLTLTAVVVRLHRDTEMFWWRKKHDSHRNA